MANDAPTQSYLRHPGDTEHKEQAAIWARRKAVLRQIWVLNEEERSWLDSHFLLRSTGEVIEEHITGNDLETEDLIKDEITIHTTRFSLEYINCSYTSITENHGSREYIMSCRFKRSWNFAVAIIQPRYRAADDAYYYKIPELQKWKASSNK